MNEIQESENSKAVSINHSRNPSNQISSSSATLNQAETVEIRSLEQALIQELMQELQIENLNCNPYELFTHKDELGCIHCRLLKQVKVMESDISKLDFEMIHTHEILKVKTTQNAELKNTIKRLEESIGKEEVVERKGVVCNCATGCWVF